MVAAYTSAQCVIYDLETAAPVVKFDSDKTYSEYFGQWLSSSFTVSDNHLRYLKLQSFTVRHLDIRYLLCFNNVSSSFTSFHRHLQCITFYLRYFKLPSFTVHHLDIRYLPCFCNISSSFTSFHCHLHCIAFYLRYLKLPSFTVHHLDIRYLCFYNDSSSFTLFTVIYSASLFIYATLSYHHLQCITLIYVTFAFTTTRHHLHHFTVIYTASLFVCATLSYHHLQCITLIYVTFSAFATPRHQLHHFTVIYSVLQPFTLPKPSFTVHHLYIRYLLCFYNISSSFT